MQWFLVVVLTLVLTLMKELSPQKIKTFVFVNNGQTESYASELRVEKTSATVRMFFAFELGAIDIHKDDNCPALSPR